MEPHTETIQQVKTQITGQKTIQLKRLIAAAVISNILFERQMLEIAQIGEL
jgi:hypothetical protein